MHEVEYPSSRPKKVLLTDGFALRIIFSLLLMYLHCLSVSVVKKTFVFFIRIA